MKNEKTVYSMITALKKLGKNALILTLPMVIASLSNPDVCLPGLKGVVGASSISIALYLIKNAYENNAFKK